MKEWMKSYDFFSPKVELYFNKKTRYFSEVGFIMSILFYLEVLFFGVYFFIQYVDCEQMSIIYSKDSKHREIKGDLSNKVFLYSLRDSKGNIVDPRIVESVPTLWKVTNEQVNVENLIEEDCSKEQFNEELVDFDSTKFKCLRKSNNENLILSSNKLPYFMEYINLYFTKCKNSTENNYHCFSDEIIEEVLESQTFFLNIFIETLSIDNSIKGNPILPSVQYLQLAMFSDSIYVYTYSMREIRYESDDGLFLNLKKVYKDFGLDIGTQGLYAFKNGGGFYVDNLLLSFQLKMDSSYIERYQRSYQKLQSLAANIGGIGSIGYFFCQIITSLFSKGSVILAINDVAYQKGNEKQIAIQGNICHLKLKTLITKNNYMKQTSSFSPVRLNGNIYSIKKRKSFSIVELLFYKCWKNRHNCKYLRDCEESVCHFLDIKNIICFWRDFETQRRESNLSIKADLSGMSSNKLFKKTQENKILNKLTCPSLGNNSSCSLEQTGKVYKD